MIVSTATKRAKFFSCDEILPWLPLPDLKYTVEKACRLWFNFCELISLFLIDILSIERGFPDTWNGSSDCERRENGSNGRRSSGVPQRRWSCDSAKTVAQMAHFEELRKLNGDANFLVAQSEGTTLVLNELLRCRTGGRTWCICLLVVLSSRQTSAALMFSTRRRLRFKPLALLSSRLLANICLARFSRRSPWNPWVFTFFEANIVVTVENVELFD